MMEIISRPGLLARPIYGPIYKEPKMNQGPLIIASKNRSYEQ